MTSLGERQRSGKTSKVDLGTGRVTEIPEPILTGKINEFGS